jgi:hypothetical protein
LAEPGDYERLVSWDTTGGMAKQKTSAIVSRKTTVKNFPK